MRSRVQLLVLVISFGVGGIAQTPQPDSDPVLQGSANYRLPQSAIDAEINGRIVMSIRVDKTGKPTKASVAALPMWPCSNTPKKELEDLFSDVSKAMLKLQFSPAMKDGKAIEKDIGLAFSLKNPKLEPKPEDRDPATGKLKVITISGGILNGKANYLHPPIYPVEAKINREEGTVKVQVLVDEKGNVSRAGTIDGPSRLQSPAREAACGAKFRPTTLSGNPVRVSGILTFNFKML